MELTCPRDGARLDRRDDCLTCPSGHSYPVYDGIPVLLLSDRDQTHGEGLRALDPKEVQQELRLDDGTTPPPSELHPVVRAILGATCGHMYFAVRNSIDHYPIPQIPLPEGPGKTLLDVGCNWGRWTVAAARKGYAVTGIDPSFGALVLARRVCRQLNLDASFICADARYLPFADSSFDVVFSYSVVQHFSKQNARMAIGEIGRVAKEMSVIQMPNRNGLRSLYHQLRHRNRIEGLFDVRYWTHAELIAAFTEHVGPTELSVDGFFGLGIQASDVDDLLAHHRAIVKASEVLRKASTRWHALTHLADSLYVRSVKA